MGPKQRRPDVLQTPAPRDPDGVVLPHNLEAERATIGAALLSEAAADYIADHLAPADYFRRAHARLFTAIQALRRRDVAVDLITLREELGADLEAVVGGPAYVSSMVDGVPRSVNVDDYCGVLKDLHARRALYTFADLTCNYVAEGQHSSATLLQDADRRLMDIQAGHLDGRMLSLRDTTGALLEALEWKVSHRGELLGIGSGFASLDETLSGWQPGDLTVIGARPSIGKTTFLLNTAIAAAKALQAQGKESAVLLFSFEMTRQQLEFRILSILSAVPLTRIIGGFILAHEWGALSTAVGTMAELPIVIDDTSGLTRWQIRSSVRRVKAERGLALVGLDYVQLIPGSLERRGATRTEELTDVSRGLKELAKEVAAPILLLSQLSRQKAMYGRDAEPGLTDLRDCGALEQDADNVGFLHRKDHRAGGPTAFLLAKQRNGPTGSMMLSLDRDTVTFTDAPEATLAPAPKAATADGAEAAPKRRRSQNRLYGSREQD